MNLSLKTKVTVFIAAVVLSVSAISTFLSISVQKKSIERQVIARGIGLAEALSRSVDEGLAAENLNLIKDVEDIVHTRDVVLTQVFSTLWLGIASVPPDQLNIPPTPAALAFFSTHKSEHDFFSLNVGSWIEIYHPVFFDTHNAGIPKVLIGYVRLRISTGEIRNAVAELIVSNILAAALLTLLVVIILNEIIGWYILRPILNLHQSVARHKQGEFPENIPVKSNDEIGELSAEFNEMSRVLREREARLAEEKERLAVTLRSIGDGVIVTDIGGAITLINRVAEQMTGWSQQEAAGRQLHEVFNIINEKTKKPCENPVEKVAASGLICGLANHTALIRKDGTEIVIEDSAALIRDRHSKMVGVVLVFRDVTEKRRMEEEMLNVEKLRSVGLLAGGLAHDFNNLLTAIVGNVSLAKKFIQPDHKAHARLEEAEKATRRAASLTQQLLTFSKGGAPVRAARPIADIIREAAALILSGSAVACEFAAKDDIWNVNVDAGQMSQVFNNLIINAVQAMPNGGMITFTIENVVLADKEIAALKAGAYVKIDVRDRGVGIPEEHLARIFEPYFTTKEQGSGLGLASVFSVIKKHDGHISVESAPALGTTFHVYLPALPGKCAAQDAGVARIADGRGRILVMDDEVLIRSIAGELLNELGYDASFAQNGREAVALYQRAREEKKPFDVVIMDLTIPGGMGGEEAIRQLRALDPDVKAIVSSGYSNDPVMADFEKHGFQGVIVKPYSVENFSTTLHTVLEAKRHG